MRIRIRHIVIDMSTRMSFNRVVGKRQDGCGVDVVVNFDFEIQKYIISFVRRLTLRA